MRPLLIDVVDTRNGGSARYAFIRSPVRIGRRQDGDLALADPFVSACHGIFQFDERDVWYTDLRSRNGTLAGGVPLRGAAPVLLGGASELRIGPLCLSVSRGAPAGGPEPLGGASGTIGPGTVTALMDRLARTPDFDATDAWAGSLRPGLVIGRFELVREVGRGGFAIVFEARDRQLGRAVAFKALRPRDQRGRLREEWLQREAEAAAQLNHPNIVSLYDAGTWEGGPFLVLELLRGETLAVRLERAPLPLGEALQVAVEVGRALAHAHAARVVHRDLKPSNVFLTEAGWTKVLDFGLAHVLGAGRPIQGGTPGYMAPEQRAGAEPDARGDVFSAALVLCESAGAAVPQVGAPAALCDARLPGGPPCLSALVQRALSPEVAERPDARAWLEGLLSAQREAATVLDRVDA